jgi:hypothetical protein
MIDTTRTIEIRQSPWRMLLLIAGALAFVVLGLALIYGWMDARRSDHFVQAIGWISVLFFGACGLVGAWRLMSVRGPVVTISPQGIRDVRIAKETIPWPAIHDISTWSFQYQKVMVLAVDPAVERRLTLSAIARMSRRANASLGADGLCIAATGLSMRYDDLLATTKAYAESYRRG